MAHPSLSRLLAKKSFPQLPSKDAYERRLEVLQRRMLLVQQGLYHGGRRAVIAFEGFDAAGKGGVIRRIAEAVDPRGLRVVAVGPPRPEEQGRHWQWRFWRDLPLPGTIVVFDRTWYGRVLVERVERLAPREAVRRAYREIVDLERALVDDGIDLVKIFLGITKREQLRRFDSRLDDPYKQWKLGEADLRAREAWDDYVEAADDLLARTDHPRARWHLVPAEHKWFARVEALRIVTSALGRHARWMEAKALEAKRTKRLRKELARRSP